MMALCVAAIAPRSQLSLRAEAWARTDAALQLVQLPTQPVGATPGVAWGSCQEHGDLSILSAVTFCCNLGLREDSVAAKIMGKDAGIAHHCLTVLQLSQNGVAMVEAGKNGPSSSVSITCGFWQGPFSGDQLSTKSAICKGTYWSSERKKAATGMLGRYLANGYKADPSYAPTLAGLGQWSVAYRAEFPQYDVLSTKCQKYSTGVYNAVTHSHRGDDQGALAAVAHAACSALTWTPALARLCTGAGAAQ